MRSRSFMLAFAIGGGIAILAVLLITSLMRDPPPSELPAEFDPSVFTGERPKLDAPYVASEHEVVQRMLELAEVDSDDFVVDLGSGDGRILIAAARERGARGLGVDIDPARIRDSRFNARAAGVEDKVEFRREDLFETPLEEADVLTLYLSSEINRRLRPRILDEMRPGTRVVSHAFGMGDWQHEAWERVGTSNVYLWIVPADVEGSWNLNVGGRNARLEFDQEFQELEGTVTAGGRTIPIEHGRVKGDVVEFVADFGGGRRVFHGRVQDGQIAPAPGGDTALSLPRASGWRAVRAS